MREVAPCIHSIFEITNDRESDRGQAGWHPIDDLERPPREVTEWLVPQMFRLIPATRQVLCNTVQHRTYRTDWQQQPEEHTEHMLMVVISARSTEIRTISVASISLVSERIHSASSRRASVRLLSLSAI